MGSYEEIRGLFVVGKAQRTMHKDSSAALQYTPDLRNVYFHVNEGYIPRIFPYFNGKMLQICNQQKQFLSQFQIDFYIDSIFKGYIYIYIFI